jgi:mycothiol system anti-sigma-R factor
MTMDCREFRDYLYLYLDGEFGEQESLAMEEHMRGCPACRAEASAELEFLKTIRDRCAEPESMPEARRQRVLGRLDEALNPPARDPFAFFRPLVLLPGAAAAALLLVLLVQALRGGGGDEDAFIRESVAAHESALPTEVEGSEDQVLRYLQARSGLAPRVPLRGQDLRLVGARIDRVGSLPAVVYSYDYHGRPVSVVQYDPGGLAVDKIPAGLPFVKAGGYGVSLFNTGGYLNAAVGDLPERELLKVVPASYRR